MSPFCHFSDSLDLEPNNENEKMANLSAEATNLKRKGIFFSPTFKVEEKKVSLFFQFMDPGLRYGHQKPP